MARLKAINGSCCFIIVLFVGVSRCIVGYYSCDRICVIVVIENVCFIKCDIDGVWFSYGSFCCGGIVFNIGYCYGVSISGYVYEVWSVGVVVLFEVVRYIFFGNSGYYCIEYIIIIRIVLYIKV